MTVAGWTSEERFSLNCAARAGVISFNLDPLKNLRTLPDITLDDGLKEPFGKKFQLNIFEVPLQRACPEVECPQYSQLSARHILYPRPTGAHLIYDQKSSKCLDALLFVPQRNRPALSGSS